MTADLRDTKSMAKNWHIDAIEEMRDIAYAEASPILPFLAPFQPELGIETEA